MAMIRHAYVAKEGLACLIGVLMAQGAASAESKILHILVLSFLPHPLFPGSSLEKR